MMLDVDANEVEVHSCTFLGHFRSASIILRFPSLFFVEWRSKNGRDTTAMLNRRKPDRSRVDLDETLTLTTDLLYHRKEKRFLAK